MSPGDVVTATLPIPQNIVFSVCGACTVPFTNVTFKAAGNTCEQYTGVGGIYGVGVGVGVDVGLNVWTVDCARVGVGAGGIVGCVAGESDPLLLLAMGADVFL